MNTAAMYRQVMDHAPSQLDQMAALMRDHAEALGFDLADPAAVGILRLLVERAEAYDLAGDSRFVALVTEFGAVLHAAA